MLVCGVALADRDPIGVGSRSTPGGVIAPDVSIDGIPVGGFTIDAARRAVIDARIAPRLVPLVISLKGRRVSIKPAVAGYSVDLNQAIDTALSYGRAFRSRRRSTSRSRRWSTVHGSARCSGIAHGTSSSLRSTQRCRSGPRGPGVRPPRIGTLIDIPKATPIVADALLTRGVPQVELPVRRSGRLG